MSVWLFVILIRYGVIPWRIAIAPLIILAEVILFYFVLLVVNPYLPHSIGPYANFISATIRLQIAVTLTGYLSFVLYIRVIKNRG